MSACTVHKEGVDRTIFLWTVREGDASRVPWMSGLVKTPKLFVKLLLFARVQNIFQVVIPEPGPKPVELVVTAARSTSLDTILVPSSLFGFFLLFWGVGMAGKR